MEKYCVFFFLIYEENNLKWMCKIAVYTQFSYLVEWGKKDCIGFYYFPLFWHFYLHATSIFGNPLQTRFLFLFRACNLALNLVLNNVIEKRKKFFVWESHLWVFNWGFSLFCSSVSWGIEKCCCNWFCGIWNGK